MVRRARVGIAEFVVGIAAAANDVLLEPRRHLIGRHDGAHFQAPGIVLERLGGGAGEYATHAGGRGAGEYDAASEQGAAIEQPIAGNRFQRRSLAASANSHAVSSLVDCGVLLRRSCSLWRAAPICRCAVSLRVSIAAVEPAPRSNNVPLD